MDKVDRKLTKEWVIKRLPKRPQDANKGTFGKVLVVAGSENFPGAAYLACAACYKIGAGLVTLVTDPTVKIITSKKLLEVVFLPLNQAWEKIKNYDAILAGPGLGQEPDKVKIIKQLLQNKLPVTVIDADGLNILSRIGEWWKIMDQETILTPHPGEMARLTGLTVQEIQSDRIHIVQSFAKKWNKIVVLKGANTVIAPPVGKVVISPFANPVLAIAGTGDVLAGIIAGMLAQYRSGTGLVQELNGFDAACVGVYIHGLAGEKLRKKIGDAGGLASDLLPLLPQVIKNLV